MCLVMLDNTKVIAFNCGTLCYESGSLPYTCNIYSPTFLNDGNISHVVFRQ